MQQFSRSCCSFLGAGFSDLLKSTQTSRLLFSGSRFFPVSALSSPPASGEAVKGRHAAPSRPSSGLCGPLCHPAATGR